MIAFGNCLLLMSLLQAVEGINDIKDLINIQHRPLLDFKALLDSKVPLPKAVCLLFLGVECPVSNTMSQEFARLHKEYGPKGVLIVGVYTEPDFSPAKAATHAKEYSLAFPIVLDPKQTLAGQAKITLVPEAAILDAKGKLLWHGRINDLYTPEGKKRVAPTTHDLRNALNALLLGKDLPPPAGKGYGCPLPELRN